MQKSINWKDVCVCVVGRGEEKQGKQVKHDVIISHIKIPHSTYARSQTALTLRQYGNWNADNFEILDLMSWSIITA